MDILESAMLMYPNSRLIFAGDCNADPGTVGGPFGLSSNEQGVILGRYLIRWDYVSTHLHFRPSLSVHTYESEAHGSHSAIDHVLCPRYLLKAISQSNVLSDHPLNTSDHLPVWVELNIDLIAHPISVSRQSKGPNNFIPCWKRLSECSREKYAEHLESYLPVLSSNTSEPEIEEVTNKIVATFNSAAKCYVPCKIFRKHVRPNWSESLKNAHSHSKSCYRDWVKSGRPQQADNPAKKKYKEAKRLFRQEFRMYSRNCTDDFYASLDVSGNDCYRLIRNFLICQEYN
jgi:hypothetical protein